LADRLLVAYSVEKLLFFGFWTFPQKRVSIKTMSYIHSTNRNWSNLRKNRVFQHNRSEPFIRVAEICTNPIAAYRSGPAPRFLWRRIGGSGHKRLFTRCDFQSTDMALSANNGNSHLCFRTVRCWCHQGSYLL